MSDAVESSFQLTVRHQPKRSVIKRVKELKSQICCIAAGYSTKYDCVG